MKKITTIALVALTVPALLLTGCGNTQIKLKTQEFETSKTIANHVIDFANQVEAFKTLSSEYEANLNNDASQKHLFAFNKIDEINKNFVFVMPAIDMRINDRPAWSYDLSYVFAGFEDFSLVNTNYGSDNDSSRNYYYFYSQSALALDQTSPLPKPEISISGYQTDDVAVESYIKSFGNALKFKTTPASDYQVEVSAEFAYPSNTEVSETETGTIGGEDYLKVERDDQNSKIIITYQNDIGILKKKEVTFKTENGKVQKIVRYFECDNATADPIEWTANTLKDYSYEFGESDYLGLYKNLKTFNNVGYFKGEQVITNQISNKLEFYMLKDGNIMANYNAKNGSNATTAEVLILNGRSSGYVKYKSGNHKIDNIETIFEDKKQNKFARATQAEKDASTKTYVYKYKDGKITATIVGG